MIAGVLLAFTVLLGAVALIELRERAIERGDEATRNRENLRVRNVHAKAGNRWYPHEMADGRVRWYPVDDEYAVDL